MVTNNWFILWTVLASLQLCSVCPDNLQTTSTLYSIMTPLKYILKNIMENGAGLNVLELFVVLFFVVTIGGNVQNMKPVQDAWVKVFRIIL